MSNQFDEFGELITNMSSGLSGIYCPICGHELVKNGTVLLCPACSTAVPVSNYDCKMFFYQQGCKFIHIEK